ncbi:imidazole glycerol phosphate synthase subunit HisH [Demequina sp. TTPB684]|uniref:imidazole glycerol phosphate synthase subunit HisH n=1 Tax=unclassified Demequina TaxID=2620311 RepID=UPI001CF3611E|nr:MULTISPECIES: imidazole glycerol phosphate synthase subunit HisH [unclassified Demequina]MCB2413607.1 imidazole glycerol phosphate synthase subunit HisH [Demequina sp. TTPB684]UPU88269.1 imidazole glycerol phosphate synthase subunit HisH [Demequina sp. TMPB413]
MTTAAVTIIDYGVGNVASVANMLKKAGFESRLSGDPDDVAVSDKLILPGVGAFDRAAGILRESGLKDAVLAAAQRGTAVLGVCLGMQLLLDGSEEGAGTEQGIGLIPGRVRRFPIEVERAGLKVPHMGWNAVTRVGSQSVLPSFRDGDRFYFVHSYYADPHEEAHRLAVCRHGIEFTAIVARENVTGVQFHPEKSHRMGMALLTDFAKRP